MAAADLRPVESSASSFSSLSRFFRLFSLFFGLHPPGHTDEFNFKVSQLFDFLLANSTQLPLVLFHVSSLVLFFIYLLKKLSSICSFHGAVCMNVMQKNNTNPTLIFWAV